MRKLVPAFAFGRYPSAPQEMFTVPGRVSFGRVRA